MNPGIDAPRPKKTASPAVGYVILALILGMGMGGACSTCLQGAAQQGEEVVPGSREKVGVLDLIGVISDATDFLRQLRELQKRDDLRAIVIRIDSPGGAVAPSQEIFQGLRRASKQKPIVCS